MSTEQPPEPSNVILQRFFETSESARKAAAHLRSAAEVGVQFTDVEGDFRFTLVDGKPRFLDGKAKDPDFELTMAPGAVTAIAARPNADVGDLGILFFQHIVAQDPEGKIQDENEVLVLLKTQRIHLARLTARILELHPYEVPEVLAIPVEQGHQAYLEWIARETA